MPPRESDEADEKTREVEEGAEPEEGAVSEKWGHLVNLAAAALCRKDYSRKLIAESPRGRSWGDEFLRDPESAVVRKIAHFWRFAREFIAGGILNVRPMGGG
jgi:hypothetical protein